MTTLNTLTVNQYLLDTTPSGQIVLQRMPQKDGSSKWSVQDGNDVLNKQGEWEWQPSPSGRDDAFLERCRFATAEEGHAAYLARKGCAMSRDDIIRTAREAMPVTPDYIEHVLEFLSFDDFPLIGTGGILYVCKDPMSNLRVYRWTGSDYCWVIGKGYIEGNV